LKNDTLSRRYAKALYELGIEEHLEQKFLTDLHIIVGLTKESLDFKTIMESPLYDIILKKKIIESLLQGLNISKYINNFINILIEKDRFNQLNDILQSYHDIINEISGKAKAYVKSAVELTQIQQQKITEAFSKITNKKVEIDASVDHSLIGGLIVDIEGMVYDGSIKTQIIKFKQNLKGEI
jgi:F-type H+-transporting ATPase subunit delta